MDLRWNQSVRSGEQIGGWNIQTNSSTTILGEAQWKWLEEEFKKPAKVRIIMSSLQFASTYTGDEAWNLFPHEKQRMLDLIKSTQAEGLLIVSGDIHYAEYSAIASEPNLYPIYDFTSSGMTHLSSSVAENGNRISESFVKNNYGLITIDWNSTPVKVNVEVKGVGNIVGLQKEITLNDLKF